MTSRARVAVPVAIAAAAVLALAGCAGGDGGGTGEDAGPIKIGAIMTKTGTPYSFEAVGIEPTVRYVFDQVNAAGGIQGRQIEYTVVDDANTPAGAVQAASQLVDQDGVVALVGGGSYTACAANDAFYVESGIYDIQAVGDENCGKAQNITRTNPGPLTVNTAAMVYAAEELGAENVCALLIAGPGIPENQESIAWFEQVTGEAFGLTDFTIPPDTADMTPYLLQAKDAGCDAILMGGNIGDVAAIASQMATQGMQDVIMLPLGGYDPAVAAAIEPTGVPVYLAIEFAPLDDTSADMAAYLEAGETGAFPINSFTQGAWLSATYAVQVLESIEGPITRESVSAAFESMAPITNSIAGGPFVVGTPADRVPNTTVRLVTVEDGAWVLAQDDPFTLPPRS